jgi:hypothetical protein
MPSDRKIDFISNRRRAPRFAMPLNVDLQPQGEPNSEWAHGRIRDISIRGFYFFSAIRHSVGSRFRFLVPFQSGVVAPDKKLIAGVAKVVRCESLDASTSATPFGVALEIEEIAPPK